MRDIETEEALVSKVGGKFKLTTLIQKRMVELNRGSAPLVEVEGDEPDPWTIVVKEILEGKIELSPRGEIEAPLSQPEPSGEAPPPEEPQLPRPTEPAAEEGEDVEIYGSDIKKIKEQRIKELSQLLNPKK